jgi:hypothetical protein
LEEKVIEIEKNLEVWKLYSQNPFQNLDDDDDDSWEPDINLTLEPEILRGDAVLAVLMLKREVLCAGWNLF